MRVDAVSRNSDQLDLFYIDSTGRVISSWWHQGTFWSELFSVGGFFPPGAAVTAVARMDNHLDLFVTGNDGRVYTSWWYQGSTGQVSMTIGVPSAASSHPVRRGRGRPHARQSRPVHHRKRRPRLHLLVVPRRRLVRHQRQLASHRRILPTRCARRRGRPHSHNLDLFITGNDGRVYTSWWFQGVDWSGINDNWRPIGGFFPPGAPVAAVARTPNNLDLFITGNDGRVYTSWWFQGVDWSGINDNWRPIGGFFPPAAPLGAVARTPGNLDLFITGNDGRVYTSWWFQGVDWSGINDNWRPIGGFFPAAAPVAAVDDRAPLGLGAGVHRERPRAEARPHLPRVAEHVHRRGDLGAEGLHVELRGRAGGAGRLAGEMLGVHRLEVDPRGQQGFRRRSRRRCRRCGPRARGPRRPPRGRRGRPLPRRCRRAHLPRERARGWSGWERQRSRAHPGPRSARSHPGRVSSRRRDATPRRPRATPPPTVSTAVGVER